VLERERLMLLAALDAVELDCVVAFPPPEAASS
jgi:hypothetical protein